MADKQTTREIGFLAEDEALDYLKNRGLELITRNYEKKSGEIDLIMKDKEYYVFIEVRFRKESDWSTALESITQTKINRIHTTATKYLLENNLFDQVDCRFDVVAIDEKENKWNYEWIINAF